MLRFTCSTIRHFSVNPLQLSQSKRFLLLVFASKKDNPFRKYLVAFQKCRRHTSKRLPFIVTSLTRLSVATPLILAAALLPSRTVNKDQFSKMIKEADALFDALKYDELYQLLLKHKDERNDEILWRMARATYQMAKSAPSSVEKVKLLKEGKDYVKQALEIHEDNFAAHKWAAILIIELAEQEGTKAKIEQSIVSKEHMLKAHGLNPSDGTTLYLLGVWCFSFAELSWTQRKLASVVFATPPTSTFEEALEYFSKAELVEPNFYGKNLLMLGKTHLQLKDNEKAVTFLKQARDYPLKTDDDKEASKEATEILKSLGVP